MKIYCIYIVLDPDEYEKLRQSMLLIRRHVRYLDNGRVSSFYAWTTNKKTANEFLELHKKDYFIILKKEIEDEEEWNNFDIEYSHLKLKRMNYVYNVKNETIKILSTFEEYTAVTGNFSEFQYDILDKFISVDPSLFKEKYYQALKTAMYVYEYNIRKLDFCDRVGNVEPRPKIINNELGLYTILFGDILE